MRLQALGPLQNPNDERNNNSTTGTAVDATEEGAHDVAKKESSSGNTTAIVITAVVVAVVAVVMAVVAAVCMHQRTKKNKNVQNVSMIAQNKHEKTSDASAMPHNTVGSSINDYKAHEVHNYQQIANDRVLDSGEFSSSQFPGSE